MVAIATPRISIEEFEQMPDDGRRWELVHGELVELSATTPRHAACCNRIAYQLSMVVLPQQLGEVYVSEPGFVVSTESSTARVPDIAFVSTARLPALGDQNRMGRVVPDLVVEVVSPSDRWKDVWQKAAMWLAAGVQFVWVVDPAEAEVVSLAPDAPSRRFAATDTLDAGALVPGFRARVSDLFPD